MGIDKRYAVKRKINPASVWPLIPYAGTKFPPVPDEPTAGLWPMFFFKRDRYGNIVTKRGNYIDRIIRPPDKTIDFKGKQLRIVQRVLKHITFRQIIIVKYWGDGPATKQWTPIIDRLIDTYVTTAPEAARILGIMQAAFNDVFVISWYYKFLWNIARPNQLDQNLATIVCTPSHPSYPSGHSAIAGCAATILSYFFRGESRRLHELAKECSLSRLIAGVHYPIDNQEGLKLGKNIGRIIVNELKKQRIPCYKRIDRIYTRNLNAKLPPPPYKQAIPFDRNMKCNSLTIR